MRIPNEIIEPSKLSLSKGSAALAQVRNVWETNTLDGSGGTAYNSAYPGSDRNSILQAEAPTSLTARLPLLASGADYMAPGQDGTLGELDLQGRPALRVSQQCAGAMQLQRRDPANMLEPMFFTPLEA